VDAKGNSALMGVAFKGETEVAERLLQERCNVNAANGAGQTALMMGALFDRTAIVKLLIARGADPTLEDAAGNTALGLATQQRNFKMVDLLGEKAR
jgi:uncharacterized protein